MDMEQGELQRLLNLCKYFSKSERFPVNLLYYEEIVAAFPQLHIKGDTYHEQFLTDFDVSNGPIAIAETKGHLLFGWLWVVSNSPYSILIGPVKTSDASDNNYIRLLPNPDNLDEEDQKTLNGLIYGSPVLTYQQLYNKLALLNLIVNGQESESLPAYLSHAECYAEEIAASQENENYRLREFGVMHSNYRYERTLVHSVALGDQSSLEKLQDQGDAYIFKPRYSEDDLRTAKDNFIMTVTLVSRAAISGGLDVETALLLCDNYVMLAERCMTIEQLERLSSTMLSKYIRKTARLQLPTDTPKIVIDCVSYISANITSPITTQTVADNFGKRREYLSALFKQYTGYPISQFIMLQRIENAKALLRYTKLSLVQIGFHLCFSDQSHFQRVFKKYAGMTPMEFRQKYQ